MKYIYILSTFVFLLGCSGEGVDLVSPNFDVRETQLVVNGQTQTVTYVERDGLAVSGGDIILGTIAEIESVTTSDASGLAVVAERSQWPNERVPYTFNDDVPQSHRRILESAIEDWHRKTVYRFVPATSSDSTVLEVQFIVNPDIGGAATVGFGRDRANFLQMVEGSTVSNMRHELGHVIGLWHTHSRADRDDYIIVNEENIIPKHLHNYDIQYGSTPTGVYDTNSFMHYWSDALSADGEPTITRLDGSLIEYSGEFSDSDINNIAEITGNPVGEIEYAHCSDIGCTRVDLEVFAHDPDGENNMRFDIVVNGKWQRQAYGLRTRVGTAMWSRLDTIVELPIGENEVCINAVNAGRGKHRQLGCKTFKPNRSEQNPEGEVQVFSNGDGTVFVGGYVLDPASPREVFVLFEVNGEVVDAGFANIERPDMADKYPGLGLNHGLWKRLPGNVGDVVCVLASSAVSGDDITIDCATIE